MSWLTNWDEAAKRPRRTVAAMAVMGAAGGFLVGYLGDHSVGFGVALAAGFALVLGVLGWRTVNDSDRLAELREHRRDPWRAVRRGGVRLGVLFAAPLVAALAGIIADSVDVFVAAFAICLVVAFVVSRVLPR